MKHYEFLNLAKVNSPYSEELKKACAEVIDSGRYIGGKEVAQAEEMIARLCGTGYCVGVGNGLDALRIIIRSYIELGKINPGDEIIVPANTFIASVLAITESGCRPAFVEPSADTHNIDFTKLEKAITSKTKAIMVVHLYGLPCWSEMLDSLRKRYGLIVIEDAAQAIGATWKGVPCGHLGDAAAFSFYPTKNIGALGDAGAIVTDNRDVAEMAVALRNYGSNRQYYNEYCGFNSRMDPVQAAMLKVKLPYVHVENEGRRMLAGVYESLIDNPQVTKPLFCDGHVYHQYVVRVGNREDFRNYLMSHGVETAVHYPVPPFRQQCYSEYNGLDFPVATALSGEVVSLPISHHCTSPEDAAEISRIINSYGK